MNTILQNLQTELQQISQAVMVAIPHDEPLYVPTGNWSIPSVTRSELSELAMSIASAIQERGKDAIGTGEPRLVDYQRRLTFLRTQVIPNIPGNPTVGVQLYESTMNGLWEALKQALTRPGPSADAIKATRRIAARIRAMETNLNKLEPRASGLTNMVERIESAHDAADQLPTDLEALTEARRDVKEIADRVADIVHDAEQNRLQIREACEQSIELKVTLEKRAEEAVAIVSRCESAYSAATSQGLAAAFAARSTSLERSMWAWVVGLVVALIAGAWFGTSQLKNLADLLNNPAIQAGTVALHLVLSVCAIGGPIWFAWLATKQVGQRFRLSEDYAFKASVSQAYEGYRREAARLDTDMEVSLLKSALARLDEQPLRLVESNSYGSPWHEMLASETVKEAIKLVPGFTNQIADVAKAALKNRRKVPLLPVVLPEMNDAEA
jgi:hypothetical protein